MRWLRHLFAPSSRRWFPDDRLQRIAAAIATSEQRHSGEICFAVESRLRIPAVFGGQGARDRGQELFAQLRVWDTRHNNGVLLYLLLAEHRIELIADRGFDGLIDAEQWRAVCALIEQHLQAGTPETAIVQGIEALSGLIADHFAAIPGDPGNNELPDLPYRL